MGDKDIKTDAMKKANSEIYERKQFIDKLNSNKYSKEKIYEYLKNNKLPKK